VAGVYPPPVRPLLAPALAPFFAAALALTGCAAPAPRAAPAPPIPVPADAALAATRPAVERLLAVEAARFKLPGLAFGLVSRSGLVYFIGEGARDEDGAPVTQETVYRIGSITKTFTGMALLVLRDAGKLDLDDPVVKYLPELAAVRYPTTDSPPIRIRHLVTHTSGLPRVGSLRWSGEDLTRLDLRNAATGSSLEYVPGTSSLYSNLAMALAGPLIARAGGEPYRVFMDRHIFGPLGMTHTVWEREAVPSDLLAQAYTQKGDGFTTVGTHWRFGAAEAMGGLYSNVSDLSRYVAFQLSAWPPRDGPDDGPLRRSSVRESQVLAGFSVGDGNGLGINWFVKQDGHLGHLVFHNGDTEGYHASIWMLPRRGFGVIALGPRSAAVDRLARAALDIIAGADARAVPRGAPARPR
jgi:CubicO group peptidase (beta-lactamase class C family)